MERVQRWRPTAGDISAFGDARIAALHAGLKLSAEQEKNWPAVESALRDLAKQRSERFAARANADRPKDPIERLNLRAEVMGQRAAALKKLADAAGPLYKSLDDAQKHRFVMLARLSARQQADGFRGHRGFGGWQHHGPRRATTAARSRNRGQGVANTPNAVSPTAPLFKKPPASAGGFSSSV